MPHVTMKQRKAANAEAVQCVSVADSVMDNNKTFFRSLRARSNSP